MPGAVDRLRQPEPPFPRPQAHAARFSLSVIVPVLNEASRIASALQALSALRTRGAQIIVVDGGSTDETAELAASHCDLLLRSRRGRAAQMNAGARAASGDALLFLHADTELPAEADRLIERALENHSWGRFDVALSGRHSLLRVIETMMNARSRLTGICTGDQTLFVARAVFAEVGGFPDIALMEDVQMSRRLRSHGRPCCLRERVRASSRRWEQNGILSTVLLMWRLRLAYFLGADPEQLARRYYGEI